MPALNISTDVSKPYSSLPQSFSPFGSRSLGGHRITQSAGGRQFQVTTDDFFRDYRVDSSYIYMEPPASNDGARDTNKT